MKGAIIHERTGKHKIKPQWDDTAYVYTKLVIIIQTDNTKNVVKSLEIMGIKKSSIVKSLNFSSVNTQKTTYFLEQF